MNVKCRNLRIIASTLVTLVLLTLVACGAQQEDQFRMNELLATPGITDTPCEACARATLYVVMTQGQSSVDAQAAATADIMRANAQATLNSANATLDAALTQEQYDANVIAAQVAETAAILRANAQATLVAAGSTQSAAQTQDAIQQTQMADLATAGAEAAAIQRNKVEIAASTQTAVANSIATQTQVAVATSQWYADQARQRAEEQRQGSIAFLWMWCLPIFIALLAGLVLWGFWRWLRIEQANQRILEKPVDKFQAPTAEVIPHQQEKLSPYLESDVVDSRFQDTKPDNRVRGWLDEVKRKLRSGNKKVEGDDTDN
jgi:hypothetical protein